MSDATWNPAGEARIRTDSSKDLEKDEREAMEEAAECCDDTLNEIVAYGLGKQEQIQMALPAWEAAKAFFEALLQQVEAELNNAKVAIDAGFRERDYLREVIAEKDLIIKVSEQHTQYWEDKCTE